MKLTEDTKPSTRIILNPSFPVNLLFGRSYNVFQPLAVLLHIGVNGADTITGTGLLGLPTLAKATSGSLTGWLKVAVNIPELSFLICVPVDGTLYSAGNVDGLYIPECGTIPPRE